MACSSKPVVNHLPQRYTPKFGTKAPSFISVPSKPIKFSHLSCSSTWGSMKNKTLHSIIVPLVAKKADYGEIDGEKVGSFNGFQLKTVVGGVGDVGVLEDAKVFVGNLSFDCDSQRLAQLFQQAGVVRIAQVIYNRETDRSRGFGFVTMSTIEEAEKAVEMLHHYELDGRLLTVDKAAPIGSQLERVPRVFEPTFRTYVGNLPWEVDNSRLKQVFSEYGKVVDARVVCERDTGRSRGFGFVTMSSETELNDAITALDGESLAGRAIKVHVAEARPRHDNF